MHTHTWTTLGILAFVIITISAETCSKYNYHVPRNLDGNIYEQYCSDICIQSYPKFESVCRDDPIIGNVRTKCSDYIKCLYPKNPDSQDVNYKVIVPIIVIATLLIVSLPILYTIYKNRTSALPCVFVAAQTQSPPQSHNGAQAEEKERELLHVAGRNASQDGDDNRNVHVV
ncbi:unnamed protein product [Owenia fusiformis]|uniref:Uncharacterized protein n=1 Tax=Owenia fusiformis TaxID=6347 RepID=A0A8J1U9K9_OWEFU|nr:unnamed protein product [Owenia fusiformis]